MTNSQKLKDKLGKTTEQIETKVGEFWTKHSHYYSNLEPWKRGTLLIVLTLFLLFAIYYLTKSDKKLSSKKEKEMEERLLRQMAFFKKLKE